MADRVLVYVELLNEGASPVWRPTTYVQLDDDCLVLSDENYDPETEEWAVSPGTRIKIEKQQAHDGLIDVAVKHDEPIQ